MLYFGKSAHTDISVNDLAGFCRANNIQFHAEDNKNELYNWQQLHEPDVIFFTGYNHKVAVEELSGVPKGIYNIHFGKLPQYRGPSPVFWQLKNGEAQLGLAIHQLSNKLDSGAVIWEQSIKNEEYHTYNYINQAFSELQVKGVFEILDKLSRKQPLNAKTQGETQAKYYNRPQLADVMVNWEKMEAKEILDLIKACTSWNNGVSTLINGCELKILDAEIALEKANNTPGIINIANNKFNVACINSKALNINFFNINNTCIPARHAGFYGLKTGQTFISKL
ncbi:MAG: methionyl-tRNA formyltransferase [Mucilaginibacter sp.]|nr:methionyl-tRNA formyltransferase [Mucilaginibacter sp.]